MTPDAPANDPGGPALDADITAWLDAAIEPQPLAPQAHARIKQRLLRRVAAASTPQHFTLKADQGRWQPFGSGLQIKVLNDAGGVMSYLVRLQPGASLPAHRHPIDEECVVLEGEVRIGELRLGAGGFHLGRKHVLHDRLVSDTGALIFLRGAVPELATAL